jgi:hypothetical protein
MLITKIGRVFRIWGDINGGTLCKVSIAVARSRGRGGPYGGNARFGRRSIKTSPSLGGGMRFSGDQTDVGVFQGTTGFMSLCGGVVDAHRNRVRRRHWRFTCGRARNNAEESRGGGIVMCCGRNLWYGSWMYEISRC